jgi:predicted 3-demethylubiquinone-9 3-methyltransferase (glyoxalase superfamily)
MFQGRALEALKVYVALFAVCQSEAEIQRLSAELSAGGEVLMEPADYGFCRQFSWLNDRFGVSWQSNLP